MSANFENKKVVVSEIESYAKDAKSIVLVDYRGLTVEEDTELRKQLREAGVTYKVYKNTYAKRAFEGTDYAQLDVNLDGPSAFAFGVEDATAPARVLSEFMKNAPALEFKAGVVEGVYYDVKGIEKIALIPSREVLIAKFMGSIQSPVSKAVRTFQAIADAKAE